MRIGLIGAGGFALRGPLPAIESHPALELTAIYSRTAETAAVAAEQFGGAVCPSVDALLARRDVDAVFLVTPPGTHLALGMAAIEARKPLICEKPATLSARDAARLAQRAAALGVPNAVNHEYRYDPAVRIITDMVRDGALGRTRLSAMTAIATFANDPAFAAMRHWGFHHDITRGGGLLPQFASHLLDLHLAVFGGIEPAGGHLPIFVTSRPTRPTEPGGPDGPEQAVTAEDSAVLAARLPDEGAAALALTYVATSQPDLRWTIHGDCGSILYQGADGWFGGTLSCAQGWMGTPADVPVPARRRAHEAPGLNGWMQDLIADLLLDFRAVLGGETREGRYATLADEAAVWRAIEGWRAG